MLDTQLMVKLDCLQKFSAASRSRDASQRRMSAQGDIHHGASLHFKPTA